MSKRLLSATLIAGLGLVSVPGANASDGTITINGLVLGTTCNINGGTSSFTVTLPTVKTTDFVSSVAGKTQFDLNLTDCPTGVDFSPAVQVSTTFSVVVSFPEMPWQTSSSLALTAAWAK